jgi:hypothetical protein
MLTDHRTSCVGGQEFMQRTFMNGSGRNKKITNIQILMVIKE